MTALRARLGGRIGALPLEFELEVARGTLAVVGPNGAGKTSLLLMLLGALQPANGRIELGDRVLFDSDAGIDVPLEDRRLGYVPQEYALFPHLSVQDNIRFALRSSGVAGPELEARAREALAELKLERFAERRVTALSGGEQQRVALARALSVRPQALLLDEPLAAFDIAARRETRAFLAEYLQRLDLPTLVVTHDAGDAQALGQQIAVLEAGRIVQCGTWQELDARPASRFVREFLRGAA
ncbi:MAG TPA: ABC transporter ATP-binding protein [Polyangiaceae bacterium]|nr:ABC transporter ATP-binding protein [Polyangiaceae bacterium]